jgi:inhibitor of KinA
LKEREVRGVKFSPVGDLALLIDFSDESPNERLYRALSAAATLERARIPGIIEITSAYESVALFLSPSALEDRFLTDQVSRAINSPGEKPRFQGREIKIPVCYDEEFALDVARVGNETKFSIAKIIELHSSTTFIVACLGFMPGFPYLAGLPVELRVPRLATPRLKVPAGSVAIANAQAGIYPFESPGGWNIIGRTPVSLFDPNKAPPALLAPGDRVLFSQITREQFDATNET